MPNHDYLILHGINLNMFGRRDARVYGTATLEDINRALLNVASQMGVRLDFFQSNHEGAMAERIHRALDDGTRGVVINAGAWTHYSYGLLDALNILSVPIVEVHMSHVASREEFRRHSVIAPACCGTIAGFGVNSYLLGLMALDQVVQERDRQRLRKMTFYCFTNECLRDYILRYFGEYGSNYCGNCSNCLSQFEETDVTEIAQKLMGCVRQCRQRYGTNVIIDTVRGANTAKIRQYRMDENVYYASLAKVPTHRLRQVMNHLMLQEYLAVTPDDYAIVKLTDKSARILEEGERVIMKMAKEQESSEKKGAAGKTAGKKKTARTPGGFVLDEEEEQLFEVLRRLRGRIANAEGVPSYIVFSDKTLAHMCIVRPVNREQMLTVSGVGVFKYEKYGEQFLDSVRDFTRNYRKNEGPDSLGAVDFSSLDYDVVQDYEGEDGI